MQISHTGLQSITHRTTAGNQLGEDAEGPWLPLAVPPTHRQQSEPQKQPANSQKTAVPAGCSACASQMGSDHERLRHQTHIMGAGTWNVLELLSASSDTRWCQKIPSAPVFVFKSAIRPGISLAGKAGLPCRTHAGPLRAQLLCHSCLIFKEPFDVCGRATDAQVSHRKPASQNRHSGAHQLSLDASAEQPCAALGVRADLQLQTSGKAVHREQQSVKHPDLPAHKPEAQPSRAKQAALASHLVLQRGGPRSKRISQSRTRTGPIGGG